MVNTFKFTPLRNNIRVEVLLTRPILAWEAVPGRFFSMVYDALLGKIPVNPGDFSVNPATVLGDARAKYNIYGGATSVALHSDKLIFDFPNITSSDYPTVRAIMMAIHDAFPTVFPELQYDRLEVQSLEHVELLEREGVRLFLDRYKVQDSERSFGSPVVIQPQVRFTAVAEDQSWECSFAAERSRLSANALFIVVAISMRRVSPSTPYLDKANAVSALVASCFKVVGLENINATIN
jgi:hypothetical protein